MAILSVFYAAFGYLALLGAILWGMLFLGGDVGFPNVDAAAGAAAPAAASLDLGLLLALAALHRSLRQGALRHVVRRWIPRALGRSTEAWAAATALAALYVLWQPLPQTLWHATGPVRWGLEAMFYLAWTLILIGAFLASHLDLFEITGAADWAPAADAGAALVPSALRQPLQAGMLLAVWAAPRMSVGHLLLAGAVTAYLLFSRAWAARKSAAKAIRGPSRPSVRASRVGA